MRTV
ncbi:23S rRNA (uracil-5-)-methyltransferase RumB, partial [Yersinia pestis PY-101]|jgi:hypothetical protein